MNLQQQTPPPTSVETTPEVPLSQQIHSDIAELFDELTGITADDYHEASIQSPLC